MLLKLPQVVGQLGKFKDSQEYHPLVKVCTAFSRLSKAVCGMFVAYMYGAHKQVPR